MHVISNLNLAPSSFFVTIQHPRYLKSDLFRHFKALIHLIYTETLCLWSILIWSSYLQFLLIRGHSYSILNCGRINTTARKHPGITYFCVVCLKLLEFVKNSMWRSSASLVPCWSNYCAMLALLWQDYSAFSLGLLGNSYNGKKCII